MICMNCGEEVIEALKDPLFWLYELVRNRKRPSWRVLVHSKTDSEWCRTTKAEVKP